MRADAKFLLKMAVLGGAFGIGVCYVALVLGTAFRVMVTAAGA